MAKIYNLTATDVVSMMNATCNSEFHKECLKELHKNGHDAMYDEYIKAWVQVR